MIFSAKLATTYRTTLTVLDPTAGTKVTGLVAGNFTFTLSKNGANQAIAGNTFSEVSVGSNPGEYLITVSGVTGFPAATGYYVLTATRTSTNQVYRDEILVTESGAPGGTIGTGVFTAVSGNGRITDGASALDGATVRIVRSSGTLYAQTASSATGVWGPVYFDADDTYTLVVQKSSYTVGARTITVSAGIATGPGADIALTAASSTSGVLASDLWAYARQVYLDRTGTKADLEIKQAVNDAITMVATAADWPWYHTYGRVTLQPVYSTGTISVTTGSAAVAGTATVFPSWAASGEMLIDGQWETVLTRSSNTALVLDNVYARSNYSGAYTLVQWEYTLPSDVRRIESLSSDVQFPWSADPVSRATIEQSRYTWITADTRPWQWSIARDRICVWPLPSQVVGMNVLYYRMPAALVAAGDTVDFDPNLLELMRRAIDVQIATRGACSAGKPEEVSRKFEECMMRSVPQNRTARNPTLIGRGLSAWDDMMYARVT